MKYIYKFWQFYSNIGVGSAWDMNRQDRVRLSNQFSLLAIALSVFLLIAFWGASNSNLRVFWGLMLFALLFPLLNYLKMSILSRLILALTPATVVFLYDILNKLNPASERDPLTYTSPHFVIIVSVCLPFALFTLKEKIPLILAVSVVLIAGWLFDDIYRFFGAHFTQIGKNHPSYSFVMVNVVIITVLLVSTFSFMLYSSAKSEQNNQKILQDFQAQNEYLNQSEERLKSNLQVMELIRLDDEKRSFISKGLADFGVILRSFQDSQTMYRELIIHLIKYLNWQQGAIYLKNAYKTESDYLQLTAFYGISAEKYAQNQVLVGEGLLGQCFTQQKMMHLDHLPKNYFKISSGLGEALPQYLLLIPLVYDRQCLGVIELAGFTTIPEYYEEFLARLAEAVAITTYNLQNNQRTQQLLTEAEQKTLIINQKETEFAQKEAQYLAQIKALEAELKSEKVN
ncbi:MAG: GAF domain-containing protein [Microscillaceae bacterium]|jgi:hypothetical protein|nr:GAF domain-containing protein [Microscillaceae bacterium]